MNKINVLRDDILKGRNQLVDGTMAFLRLGVWELGELLSGEVVDENGFAVNRTYCWIISSDLADYLINYSDEIVFFSPELYLYFWIETGSCDYIEIYQDKKPSPVDFE